jgi:hypothetical protein
MGAKNAKWQIIIDLLMILLSIFMTIDYSLLISSGDDLVRRKVVLVIWFVAIFGWSIKLIHDLKNNAKSIK